MKHGPFSIRPVRRRAFTIVETIAVASVCSLWLGIAIPWLQTARTSERDLRCKNNLKQIGLSMHNYHDVYRQFPPGWTTKVPDQKGQAAFGWGTSILPFIEQGQLYQSISPNGQPYDGKGSMKWAKTSIALYRCPIDAIGPNNLFRGDWGTSNYVGNFGRYAIPRWDPLSADGPGQVPTLRHGGKLRWADSNDNPHADGIFAVNSSVKIRDIVDGTSNTIMAGERAIAGKSAIWVGPRSNYNESDVVADGSHSSILNVSATSYGSRHPSGQIWTLLTDGSARAITEKLESKPDGTGLLQRLSSRHDRMVIGQF